MDPAAFWLDYKQDDADGCRNIHQPECYGMVWHSVVWFVMVYTMNGSIVGVLLLPGVSALGDEKKPG